MAWVTVKCPHCGGIANKLAVNPNASPIIRHSSCQKCRKKVVYEIKNGKVKAYKD